MAREHPVVRLATRQKRGEIDALVGGTEAQIRAAYADAQGSVAGTLRQFADAYRKEQERLAAKQHEDEDRDVDGFRVRQPVPLTWLHSSGWGVRIKHAMGQASHTASQQSRRTVARGIGATGDLGTQDAHELLRLALRPAIRKGMRWEPKG